MASAITAIAPATAKKSVPNATTHPHTLTPFMDAPFLLSGLSFRTVVDAGSVAATAFLAL